MPYPESCPECGGPFRNTGTHFTARRNEVGRHVLLELGCQNTSNRFWWDFTTGALTEDGRSVPGRRDGLAVAPLEQSTNGVSHGHTNGVAGRLSTLERPAAPEARIPDELTDGPSEADNAPHADAPVLEPQPLRPIWLAGPAQPSPDAQVDGDLPTALDGATGPDAPISQAATEAPAAEPALTQESEIALDASELESALASNDPTSPIVELPGPPPGSSTSLRDAFVRQLQLDRLTLRQMRSWLMSDDARRAIEVAAGATEATYERLALILFGAELTQLLGKPAPAPASTGMSAEERLELQREKARIRARLRRAAAKSARQG